jgi:hypothetical protein
MKPYMHSVLFLDLYADLSVHERLIAIEKDFPGANIILTLLGYLPDVSPSHMETSLTRH